MLTIILIGLCLASVVWFVQGIHLFLWSIIEMVRQIFER